MDQNAQKRIYFEYNYHENVDARKMLADARKLQKMQSGGQELSNAPIPKHFQSEFSEISYVKVSWDFWFL